MANTIKIKKRGLSKEEKIDPLWATIKFPIFILILYSIFTNLLPSHFSRQNSLVIGLISFLITIFAFGYIGYISIKKLKDSKFALKAGFYAGAISGFLLAVFGLGLVYFFPERFSYTLSEIGSKLRDLGLSTDLAYTLLIISSWINLLLGTLFNALIGALISWISALIFRKK